MIDDPYPGKALLSPTEVYRWIGVSKSAFYGKVKKDPDFPHAVSLVGAPRYRKLEVWLYVQRLPKTKDEPTPRKK